MCARVHMVVQYKKILNLQSGPTHALTHMVRVIRNTYPFIIYIRIVLCYVTSKAVGGVARWYRHYRLVGEYTNALMYIQHRVS
jgi:hypothetical protein